MILHIIWILVSNSRTHIIEFYQIYVWIYIDDVTGHVTAHDETKRIIAKVVKKYSIAITPLQRVYTPTQY